MKHLIVICYGAAEHPDSIPCPDSAIIKADTPVFDKISRVSFTGMVQNVPTGYQPAQSAAPWSVFGCPVSGNANHAATELIGSGVRLRNDDVVFFADLVSLSPDKKTENRRILSVCDRLTYDNTASITEALRQHYDGSCFSFVCSKNGKCFMIWHKGEPEPGKLFPTNEVLHKAIGEFLPSGKFTAPLSDIIRRSISCLDGHPVNRRLYDEGLPAADAVWLWGASVKPRVRSFSERFGKDAAVISTNCYAGGIAKALNMPLIKAEYKQGQEKILVRKVFNEFKKGKDAVFLYLDSAALCRTYKDKRQNVKAFDRLLDDLCIHAENESLSYRLLLSPGQSVSAKTGAYGLEAVPFLIYDSQKTQIPCYNQDEMLPYDGSRFFTDGEKLLSYFFAHEE